MNTIRLTLRQRLERRTGVLLLALTVAVFWACLVAAHVMGQSGGSKNVVVSRNQLAGVHGLRMLSTSDSYGQIGVIYEDRDDVNISGLLKSDPAWRVDGVDLVLPPNSHIEVRLPPWITRLEGRKLDIKNTSEVSLSQLTLITSAGRLEGVFQSIDLTMGSPNCSADSLSRPAYNQFHVENTRAAQLKIKTASGRLSLENIDSIQQIQLSTMPGAELRLDDVNQLPRLEFTPLNETTIKATQWISAPCELN